MFAKLRKPGLRRTINIPTQNRISRKIAICGYSRQVFWGQWKGGEGLNNVVTTLALFLKILKIWCTKGLKINVFDNPTVV